MKRIKEALKNFGIACWTEIRNGLAKTPLHIIKTLAIMFIPFLYAFTYLFAFYDPIPKAENLDLKIITQRDDAVGEFIKYESDNKKIQIHNGPSVEVSANFQHIYADELKEPVTQDSDIVKDSLLTLNLPSMDSRLVFALREAANQYATDARILKSTGPAHVSLLANHFDNLVKIFTTVLSANTLEGKASMNYNYKKNFLIGFATDISSMQSGGVNEALRMILDAVAVNGGDNVFKEMVLGNVNANGEVSGYLTNDDKANNVKKTLGHKEWASPTFPSKLVAAPSEDDYQNFINDILVPLYTTVGPVFGHEGGYIINGNSPNQFPNALPIISVHTQLGTKDGKDLGVFGIGLAPFFISIGAWFGAVAMTVLIHRKIYDKKQNVIWRYLAKTFIVNMGILLQLTILMISLYGIGLHNIGARQWFIMYVFSVFIGMVFASFMMAIRLSIPSRSLSIYVIVLFMVLNIVASGGLFPIQTQNPFVRAMNKWVPMHFSVEILRQGLTDTNWAILFENVGLLSIYLLFVPLGYLLNHKYTHRWYIRYQYVMTPHMKKYHKGWIKRHPKIAKKVIKDLHDEGAKEALKEHEGGDD